MRDAIRDDASKGSPAAQRGGANSFHLAEKGRGGAGAHPEFRGDLAVEALFQMFVDIGDRKRVD